MRLRLRRWAASLDPITRGWAALSAGTAGAALLRFLAGILVARALGPAGMGVYAVLLGITTIAGSLADAGLTSAAVRRLAEVVETDAGEAVRRARGFLWLRVAIATAAFATGIAVADPLAARLGLPPDPLLVPFALAGMFAAVPASALATILQASRRFDELASVGLVQGGAGLALAGALAATGHLDLHSALLVLGVLPPAGAAVFLRRRLRPRWDLGAPPLTELRAEAPGLLRFGGWIVVGNTLLAFSSSLDVLLLHEVLPAESVGLYAVALGAANRLRLLDHALQTVTAPAAVTLEDRAARRRFLLGGLRRAAGVAVLVTPVAIAARPILELLYGPAFGDAAPLLQGLLLAVLVDIAVTPLRLLPTFADGRPARQAAVEAVRTASLAATAIGFIPWLGPAGAVVARFASSLASGAAALALGRAPARG